MMSRYISSEKNQSQWQTKLWSTYLKAIGCYYIAQSVGGVKLHSTHVHVFGRENFGKFSTVSLHFNVLTMFGFGELINNHQICQCFPLPKFFAIQYFSSSASPWTHAISYLSLDVT